MIRIRQLAAAVAAMYDGDHAVATLADIAAQYGLEAGDVAAAHAALRRVAREQSIASAPAEPPASRRVWPVRDHGHGIVTIGPSVIVGDGDVP